MHPPVLGAELYIVACDGSVLDINSELLGGQHQVLALPRRDGAQQHWRFRVHPTVPDAFLILPAHDGGTLLRCRYGSELLAEYLEYEPVAAAPSKPGKAEAWQLKDSQNGCCLIVHHASRLVLSLAGNGPVAILAHDEGSVNQRWTLEPVNHRTN
jgi:hypothetical protein